MDELSRRGLLSEPSAVASAAAGRLISFRHARAAVALVCLAMLIAIMTLLARRLFAGMTSVGMTGIDTFAYWKDANDLLHGEHDFLSERPAFDALNVLAFKTLGVNDYAIRAFIAAFAVANVALVYLLSLAVARNALVALAAAGVYAFNPTLLAYAGTELPHVTGATFVLIAALCAVLAISADANFRARLAATFMVGAASTSAIFTHEDLAFLAAGYLIVILLPLAVPADRPLVSGGRARMAAAALAAFVLGSAAGAAWPLLATGFEPERILHDMRALEATLDQNSAVRLAGDWWIVPRRFLKEITVDTFGRTITALATGAAVAVPAAFLWKRADDLRRLFTLEIPIVLYIAAFLLVIPIYLEGTYKRLIVPLAALIIVFAVGGTYLLSQRLLRGLAGIAIVAWAAYVVIGGKPWQFATPPVTPYRALYDEIKDRVTAHRKLLLPACYAVYKPWVGIGSPVYLGDNAVPIYPMQNLVSFDALIAANHIGYVYVALEPPRGGMWERDRIEQLFVTTYGVAPDPGLLDRLPRVPQEVWRNDTKVEWSPEACAFEAKVMRQLLDRRGARVVLMIPGMADIYELRRPE
ncbi:MAG: hypothetical protein JO328_21545 [Hyphomicrobiales bacterium]|nr:hypothetical protein [Hyphomicrobiales bacterium]